jgi:hypothetical protein
MIIIKRAKAYGDKLRAYKVVLDDVEIGNIRDGESKEFPTSPGRHTLQLKIDLCSSKKVEFQTGDKPVVIECGSNNPFKFSWFFKTEDYMWLRILT